MCASATLSSTNLLRLIACMNPNNFVRKFRFMDGGQDEDGISHLLAKTPISLCIYCVLSYILAMCDAPPISILFVEFPAIVCPFDVAETSRRISDLFTVHV